MVTANQIQEFENQKKLMFDITVEIIKETEKMSPILTIGENIEIPVEKITPDLDKLIKESNRLTAEGNKISQKLDSDLVKAQSYFLGVKPYIESINVEDMIEDNKLNEIINMIKKMRLDFEKSMVELKSIMIDLEKNNKRYRR